MASQFLKKLIFGPPSDDRVPPQGWARSRELFREEWDRETFGFYRLIRLALILAPWCFPTIHIDQLSRSDKPSRIAAPREVYLLLRVTFFVVVLWIGLWHHTVVVVLALYFCADILVHLAGGAIVWGRYSINPQRTLLLSFLSYGELTAAFAIFYLHTNSLNWTAPSAGKAIYFSLTTSTTLGLGDIGPANATGRELVAAQLAVFVVFLLLFLSTFVARIAPESRLQVKRDEDQ